MAITEHFMKGDTMTRQEFMTDLPKNPIKAIALLTSRMVAFDEVKTNQQRINAYEAYLDLYYTFLGYLETLRLNLNVPMLTKDRIKNVNRMMEFFRDTQAAIQRMISNEDGESSETKGLEAILLRELLVSDHDQIQFKINRLRSLVMQSNELEMGFKKRLLKKIEELQKELHRTETFGHKASGILSEFI